MKFTSLFKGIGGATIGAINAGCTPNQGCEINPDLAFIYGGNFGDYTAIDIKDFVATKTDILQASPPCTNYSGLNVGGSEQPKDVDLAMEILRQMDCSDPTHLIIENVAAYRKSAAFDYIYKSMIDRGYYCDPAEGTMINASCLGVPQTRNRFIWAASKHRRDPLLIKKESQSSWGDLQISPAWFERPLALTDNQHRAWVGAGSPPAALIPRVGWRIAPRIYEQHQPIGTIAAHLAADHNNNRRPAYNLIWDGLSYELSIYGLGQLSGMPSGYKYAGKYQDNWRGLGNIVHPIVMQRVIEQLLN